MIEYIKGQITYALRAKGLLEYCSIPVIAEGQHHQAVLVVDTLREIAELISRIPGIDHLEIHKPVGGAA